MRAILNGFIIIALLGCGVAGCKRVQRSGKPRKFKIALLALKPTDNAPAGVLPKLDGLHLRSLADPVRLTRSLKKGQERRFLLQLIQRVRMERDGVPELRAVIYQNLDLQATVGTTRDGEITETLAFRSVRLGIEPGRADVTRKLEDMMKDATLFARRKPNGELIRIDFGKGLAEELANFLATLRQTLVLIELHAPDRDLAQGERWETRVTYPLKLPAGGKMSITVAQTSQLRGQIPCPAKANATCAVVVVNGTLTLSGEVSQLGVQAKVSGKGHSQGVMLYDIVDKSTVLAEFGCRITNNVDATVGKRHHRLKQAIQLMLKRSERQK